MIRRHLMNAFGFAGAWLAVLALPAPLALADRGMVRPLGVNVEEPAQRAIIAHDGQNEILILQTDVKADQAAKLLEFMPLPSKPAVSLAPKDCFAALQEIVKTHNLRYYVQVQRKDGREGDALETVKIVVAAHLGPHDVTVVEVKDADDFVDWVKKFFREKGLGVPALADDLRDVVGDYLGRGIRFFAFDVVDVSPEQKTVQPLAYEFKCDDLYYPLKVTNLYGGRGIVELFTILPPRFRGCRVLIAPPARIKLHGITFVADPEHSRSHRFFVSTQAALKADELGRLHPGIAKLMEQEGGILQAWRYDGPLFFDSDVQVSLSRFLAAAGCQRFIVAIRNTDRQTLADTVAVPFHLDGLAQIDDAGRLVDKLMEFRGALNGMRVNALGCRDWNPLGDMERKIGHGLHLERGNAWLATASAPANEIAYFAVRRTPQGRFEVLGFRRALRYVP